MDRYRKEKPVARLFITPSRLLNDDRGIFGLGMTDFAGAIFLFVILSMSLDGTGLEILSMPIAILSLVPLIPIRLAQRRKIVRDTLLSHLKGRKLYDPRLRTRT